MEEIIEIGKVSSRGQIAVPAEIRRKMNLKEGEKVVFVFGDGTLIIKKVVAETFAEITKPLRKKNKKIKESEVNSLIHKMRKNENNS